eukprot:gene25259-biopygen10509
MNSCHEESVGDRPLWGVTLVDFGQKIDFWYMKVVPAPLAKLSSAAETPPAPRGLKRSAHEAPSLLPKVARTADLPPLPVQQPTGVIF